MLVREKRCSWFQMRENAMKDDSGGGLAGWFAATILLGAFLLFQVQPLFSKMILPWFGGSPAVWTTCLLFFQTVLLAGYAYAHGLVHVRGVSRQGLVHLTLAALALLLLPITPVESWQPPDGKNAVWRILLLLTRHVGLPYFLLAATSPLVQAWFARVYRERSPYRLYALSNLGSLVGLISYPFLVEPSLTTSRQGVVWSLAFGAYVVLCGVIALRLGRLTTVAEASSSADAAPLGRGQGAGGKTGKSPRPRLPADAASPSSPVTDRDAPTALSWSTVACWIALPALASSLLMSITNHVCQNVAVVPLLWIAPLTLYLITFIICFDKERWYVRRWFAAAAILAVLAAGYLVLFRYLDDLFESLGYRVLWWHLTHSVVLEAGVYLAILFLLCMICHGELVRRKPHPRRLTAFYLAVAAGGALGGSLVALISPLVFSSYIELNLGLLIGFGVAMHVLVKEARERWLPDVSWLLRGAASALAAAVCVVAVWGQWEAWDRERGVLRQRNFYGVLTIKERYPQKPEWAGLALFHGRTVHGFELRAADKRGRPTTYYSEESGVGRTLLAMRDATPLRVGVVGLGAGTLAAYGRAGDYFRFYEIDDDVSDLARRFFTFIPQCAAAVDIVSGDARLSLEREPPQRFDVLVLDAFSGDTVPVHLLTAEAFDVYLRHLSPRGVIAVHTSSLYVDLAPVVHNIAAHCDLKDAVVNWPQGDYSIRWAEEMGYAVTPSQWVLLTRQAEFFERPPVRGAAEALLVDRSLPLWTDQFNNLFQMLR